MERGGRLRGATTAYKSTFRFSQEAEIRYVSNYASGAWKNMVLETTDQYYWTVQCSDVATGIRFQNVDGSGVKLLGNATSFFDANAHTFLQFIGANIIFNLTYLPTTSGGCSYVGQPYVDAGAGNVLKLRMV